MSIHTLIEINHDEIPELKRHPEIIEEIVRKLGGSEFNGPLNEANDRGQSLGILGTRIRIVTQYHHSTRVTIKNPFVEVKL